MPSIPLPNQPYLDPIPADPNPAPSHPPEPHRVFRRLLILEGWSHDQAYSPVFS